MRFFVDLGDGFVDVGLAATPVSDGWVGEKEPVSCVVGVAYAPPRGSCATPSLPRVRAILSYQEKPPAGVADFEPERGDRLECAIRLPARPLRLSDYLAYLADQQVALPEWHEPLLDSELTLLPPSQPSLAQLIRRYRQSDVPVHRYALPEVLAALHSGDEARLRETATQFAEARLDWAGTVAELFNANGNTRYERLAAVGLDNNTDTLVATVVIGRSLGYNGDLCSAGSSAYVAFWADWGDVGVLDYLGSAELGTHDIAELPSGGLAYTAALPFDPVAARRAGNGGTARIRAVLSWGTPPSVTDSYALPYWGDAIEAKVRVRPGHSASGPALSNLGGVPVPMIDNVTGQPRPDAAVRDSGLAPEAFTGRLPVHGTGLRYRQLYRVMVRNVSTNAAAVAVRTPFVGVQGNRVTPGQDGWVQAGGTGGEELLGEVQVGTAGLFAVWLETVPAGPVAVHHLYLTPAPTAVEPAIPRQRLRAVPILESAATRVGETVGRRGRPVRWYSGAGYGYAGVDRKPRRLSGLLGQLRLTHPAEQAVDGGHAVRQPARRAVDLPK